MIAKRLRRLEVGGGLNHQTTEIKRGIITDYPRDRTICHKQWTFVAQILFNSVSKHSASAKIT